MEPSNFIIVLPNGKIYCIDTKTRKICWSRNMVDGLDIYSAEKKQGVNKYMDAMVNYDGNMLLCLKRNDAIEDDIRCDSPNEVTAYIRSHFGYDVSIQTRSQDVDLNYVGKRHKSEPHFIRITKTTYDIIDGRKWRLSFSNYQAQLIFNGFSVTPIRVYHTLTVQDFRSLCDSTIGVNDVIDQDIWLLNTAMPLPTLDPAPMNNNYRDLFCGTLRGYPKLVARRFPIAHLIPSHCRSFWSADDKYHPTLYGTHVGTEHYHLVFKHVGRTLFDYMSSFGLPEGRNRYLNVVTALRSLFDGLDKLHEKKICHTKINPWNLMVTEDYSVKFVGFGNFQPMTDALLAQERLSLAKLIIFIYSSIHVHTEVEYEQERGMLISDMYTWAYEAKSLVEWLQDTKSSSKLTPESFLKHPWAWSQY